MSVFKYDSMESMTDVANLLERNQPIKWQVFFTPESAFPWRVIMEVKI